MGAELMNMMIGFGIGIGAVVGLPVLKFIWGIAGDWRETVKTVQTTSATAGRTEEKVNVQDKRMDRMEQTIHGPQGDNGMYSDVRGMKEKMEKLERRIQDIKPNPGRRAGDGKKK